jgi:hypothetical protein
MSKTRHSNHSTYSRIRYNEMSELAGFNPLNNLGSIGYYHNLEVSLHMLSGFFSDAFTRDFALCNKSADVIDERAGIPPGWFATIIEKVGRSKGAALIQPYSRVLPPLDGEDNNRKIGEGPVAPETRKSEPLVMNYFERYLGIKPEALPWWQHEMGLYVKRVRALYEEATAKR